MIENEYKQAQAYISRWLLGFSAAMALFVRMENK
jgi:hypothetical protein